MDDLSNYAGMADISLTWRLVDDVAADLGANEAARLKWRQRETGVPPIWRIKIVEALMARSIPVAISDFDHLPAKPGRIAA